MHHRNPTRSALSTCLRFTFLPAFLLVAAPASAQTETAVVVRSSEDIVVALTKIEKDLERLEREPVQASTINGRPVLGAVLEDSPLGVEVVSVVDGSAAALAGLVPGDKIVEIDDFDIEIPSDVTDAISKHPTERQLRLKWIRHNHEHERSVVFVAPAIEDRIAEPAVVQMEHDELHREVVELRSQVRILTQAVKALATLHRDPVGIR
ncbi:PDZ domain-containing protein [Stieleria sp. JC731]|uniref:PDZ domain-containing protein n=1 Tax=Pirellulaceae TaxID=2691357 RepID=UPI001E50AE77|nr:PDZ domain-containing protein [Stieleria sp. JC731]MCC9603684.1 PDZ domain-containing protein [Stieleria sp. JC731]